MSTENIFDPDYTAPETIEDETPDNPLEALVGEGKKFADAAALAKAKLESDRFIQQLQAENAKMRESLTSEEQSQAKIDKILERLSQKSEGSTTHQSDSATQKDHQSDSTKKDTNSTEDVEKLVTKLISERESKSKREANMAEVSKKMLETFKGKAQDVIKTKADELNVSTEWLKDVAAQNPSAFFTLIGVTNTGGSRGNSNDLRIPQGSEVDSTKDSSGTTRDNRYWQEQRSKMGNAKFFSPTVQNQFFADLKSMGRARFYNESSS